LGIKIQLSSNIIFFEDGKALAYLGRLNHRTPPDFFNRIVSIKRSTSPSTAHFPDGQSSNKVYENKKY
jgi:hypothetical protein